MPWDPDEIARRAEKDFESTWLDSAELVLAQKSRFRSTSARGRAHPIEASRQRIRRILLGLGFDEVITPLIWEDEHVRRQYGPESAVILDRCYYLAGLPRPEIGLSKRRKAQIGRIIPGFSAFDKLTDLLREYKAGKVESDDFVEEMVRRLEIPEEKATQMIDSVFGEMKKLHPVPTRMTVLSHFTTAWFPILAEALTKKVDPVLMFTTGVRMRREQREDATHLRSHYNASIVAMSPDFTLADGRRLAKKILGRLGFEEISFVTKKATSKYYAPGTEEEVFAVHPSLVEEGGIEVADLGMYSPVALSRYSIPYPVFNMGLSIGRLAMIEQEAEDIRELTYPEIHVDARFSDREMEEALRPTSAPLTQAGRDISEALQRVARKHADAVAPCSYGAWKGRMHGQDVSVELVEVEQGVKLVGPAGFNIIHVKEGNILSSLPKRGQRLKGRLTYMRCLADYCASCVEEDARKRRSGTREIRVGMARSASDIYLHIPIAIRNYVESNNKKIDIRGPVFTTVQCTIGDS